MNARDAFKKNLPIFTVVVRGNVVADSEEKESKAGNTHQVFKVAHSFSKDGDTVFIRVYGDRAASKGDYVEVTGNYVESTNGDYLNRTIFTGEEGGVTILGVPSENAETPKGKSAPKSSKSTSRKR